MIRVTVDDHSICLRRKAREKLFALLLTVLLAASLTAQTNPASRPLALMGVTLIDMTGAPPKSGFDFVKVHGRLSRDEHLAVANEAKRINIPVAGHLSLGGSAGEASDAGLKSVEHLEGMLVSVSSEETQIRKEWNTNGYRCGWIILLSTAGLPCST